MKLALEATEDRPRMSLMRSLLRMLVGVTLVITAITLASPGAQAHAGHHHATKPSTHVVRTSSASGTLLETVATQHLVAAALLHATSVNAAGMSSDPSQACQAGCCSSGMGCCAAWMPQPIALVVPPIGRLALELLSVRGVGVKPDALAEPPKSLV